MATKITDNLYSWADDLDPKTLHQAAETARLPVIAGHVALMADAHLGYGCAIGSVVPTLGSIIPSAAGVDLGCGMAAVRTDLTASDLPDDLGRVLEGIANAVPSGMGAGHTRRENRVGVWMHKNRPATRLDNKLAATAANQLGTLGSGNHYIEASLDETGAVWVVLHSGSRGVGNKLATGHIKTAKMVERHADGVKYDADLAWFIEGTPEFDHYVADLRWAQAYAWENREIMLDAVLDVLFSAVGRGRQTERVSCFAGETEVLTSLGVVPIKDLSGGVHTLLTTNGKWVDAPVRSFGEQRIYEVTVGRYGQEKVIRTTADHRWLLRPKVRHNRIEAITAGLVPGDRLDYSFPERVVTAPSRRWVARGFVFGDGQRTEYGSRAIFYGKKDDHLLPFFDGLGGEPLSYHYIYESTIRKTYVRLGDVDSQKAAGRDVKTYKVINSLPTGWKDLPSLDAGDDEIYGWMSGYFAADGDVGKSGRPSIWSACREHLEFFKSACDRLGIWTLPIRERKAGAWSPDPDGKVFVMGISRADLDWDFFAVPEHRRRWAAGRSAVERRGWTVRSVTATDDTEEVFCAVVEGTHAFTLADNILTGNCHHNYAEVESHGGRDIWVTRKGAIRARVGDLGIIPGSMGADTFIVEGLGNELSFNSCSHGAGRRMSRTQARKTFTADSLTDAMGDRTWLGGRGDKLVDEHPGAYKDIEHVMALQADLVKVRHRLVSVLNYKGV